MVTKIYPVTQYSQKILHNVDIFRIATKMNFSQVKPEKLSKSYEIW